QNHRAARGERGSDLARDLIDWPIPRSNESAHADRLATNERRTPQLLEFELLENGERRGEMLESAGRLRMARELHGRAHLVGDGARHIVDAFLKARSHALEQRDSLLFGRLGERLE